MKKYFKSYILFALMALTFAGCKTDDLKDDLDDLKDRVTLLEEQVKILNDNVEVFAYVLNPDNKTINRVIEEEDGAFTIVLSDNQELRLEIGSQGTVSEPSITVSEDGYWVINGEKTQNKAKGEDGDNLIPEFKIEDGKWKVRFGEKGKWEDVAGEYTVSEAGDQFFESAKVEGDNFVITDKDGETKYVMPIVSGLTCAIIKENPAPTPSGYYEIEAGTKKDFDVEITGDKLLAPIYPEGWRAELTPQTETGKYTLTVYAPSSTTSTLSRATANNSEEVVVRANKGVFWAVDKIKVRLPKVYANDWEAYNDGATINIAGLSVTKAVYGEATILSSENEEITAGGVYFINDGVTVTFNSENVIDKPLLLLAVNNANFKMAKKMTIQADFICKNLNITRSGDFIAIDKDDINVAIESCKFDDKNANKVWITGLKGTEKIKLYSVIDSDFKLTGTGLAGSFLRNVNCELLRFENNLVYYYVKGDNLDAVIDINTPENQHFNNFKIYNAVNNDNPYKLNTLIMTGNTFVDTESNYKSGANGIIYVDRVDEMDISNNICYYSYPLSKFSDGDTYKEQKTTRFYRATVGKATGSKNLIYSGNADMQFTAAFGVTQPDNFEITVVTSSCFETMSKTEGKFVPIAEYKDYGAQR